MRAEVIPINCNISHRKNSNTNRKKNISLYVRTKDQAILHSIVSKNGIKIYSHGEHSDLLVSAAKRIQIK
ncbi:MAG: hypothetical protein HFJ84_10995 [Clostridiales bacterium]|nr:hypothetical protein [Clostridiales bacterium]